VGRNRSSGQQPEAYALRVTETVTRSVAAQDRRRGRVVHSGRCRGTVTADVPHPAIRHPTPPMRLSTREIAAIGEAARDCFAPDSVVRLFGSRLEDARRGGDIDLLVETPKALSPRELVECRSRFVARLYRLIGEQRIDVLVVAADAADDRPVIAVARREGRLLARVPDPTSAKAQGASP